MPLETATQGPPHGLTRQMGKIMEQLQRGYYNFAPGETWTPNVNLYETDDAYHVCVDLAGVKKDEIDLVVVDQVLTLRGRRTVPASPDVTGPSDQPRRFHVHLMEVDHGAFSRQVELPRDVDPDTIQAKYLDGMLWIHLPKRETPTQQPIQIEEPGQA